MAWRRFRRDAIFVLIALLVVVIGGTLLLMGVTRQVLHPNPQAIQSVTHTEPSPKWSAAVDRTRRIVRTALTEQNLPGLAVAVVAGGELVWTEGFGWADIAARVPVTPDTRFRIGTASTALTSAAAGVLLEKGRLKLDDEIQNLVPQFPKKQWPVTLRHLMAHVGGIGTDGGTEGPLFRQRCGTPVDAIAPIAQGPLLFEPGTQFRQSNYGWILVSAAVEAGASQPFLTFMKEQVFQPTGMNNSGAESATEENPERVGEPAEDAPLVTLLRDVILKPLGMGGAKSKQPTDPATVYFPGFGSDPLVRYGLHVMPPHNLSCYAGSMAFLSTASDMARFGLALNNGKLLQPDTVRLLQTSQRLTSGEETGYGLGWKLDTVTLNGSPAQVAGHDGELLGRRVVSFRLCPNT